MAPQIGHSDTPMSQDSRKHGLGLYDYELSQQIAVFRQILQDSIIDDHIKNESSLDLPFTT